MPNWLITVLIVIVIVGPYSLFRSIRDVLKDRKGRHGHNDRDYKCKFWWGDRSGGIGDVSRERCTICNSVT